MSAGALRCSILLSSMIVLASEAFPHSQAVYPGAIGYMEMIFLPPVTTGPWSPAWSPDGREIALSMQGSLWTVPVEGGEARQLTTGPHYDSEPSWSPDGRQIVFTRDNDASIHLWLVDSDGTHPRQLTRAGDINVNPAWSPAGDRIAYASLAEGQSLNLWSIAASGGEPKAVLEDEHQNFEPSWSPDGSKIAFLSSREARYGTGDIWILSVADSDAKAAVEGGEPLPRSTAMVPGRQHNRFRFPSHRAEPDLAASCGVRHSDAAHAADGGGLCASVVSRWSPARLRFQRRSRLFIVDDARAGGCGFGGEHHVFRS